MAEFYLTLPSNSSRAHFPDNHGGHFYSKLPQAFDLQGKSYEVGLAEIQFPNTFPNVQEGEAYIKIRYGDGPHTKLVLTAGLYKDTAALIHALNSLIKLEVRDVVKLRFHHNSNTKKVWIRLKNKKLSVLLSPFLAEMLSIDENMSGPGFFQSHSVVNIHKNAAGMYVYCDLVAHRPVGDVMAPLLRVVSASDTFKPVVHKIFWKPHYIRLSRREFDTVEVLMSTDSGEIPLFSGGKTIITLHFRPCRDS